MKAALLHIIFIFTLFFCYRVYTGQPLLPPERLLQVAWDTEHYTNIKNNGYSYDADKMSNVAFFPGFPYLWRLLGLNAYGISVLNIFLFYTGFFLWKKNFNVNWQEQLLFLSVPAIFYFYIPYSEALFFLFSVLILVGFKNAKPALTATGLFLGSVTRSAANVFLPAIVITEMLAKPLRRRQLLLFVTCALVAVGFVAAMQYYQTGNWFGFLQTQQNWGHRLQWPKLPFKTWHPHLWIDAIALMAGVVFIAIAIRFLHIRIVKKMPLQDKAVVFSVFCLAGLTFISVVMKGGLLFSLHRYLFPTAFFFVAGLYVFRRVPPTFKMFLIAFALVFAFAGVFHFFLHIKLVLQYLIIAIYFCSAILIRHTNKYLARSIFWALYICNCIIQVYLADLFLNLVWVG